MASVLVAAGCDQGKPTPNREHVQGGGGDEVAPQVAYANGFTLEVVDENDKPIAGLTLNVTTDNGTVPVTTSARGDAYVAASIEAGDQLSVQAPGYERVEHAEIEGLAVARVVLTKKAKP